MRPMFAISLLVCMGAFGGAGVLLHMSPAECMGMMGLGLAVRIAMSLEEIVVELKRLY